jgi:hypothetical protein
MTMKPVIAAAILSLIAGAAMAQTQTTTTVTKTTTITPAEEPQIKEYVVKEHVPSIPPPPGVEVREGAVMPPTVVLHPFPEDAAWHRYRYAVIGGETVLVDPASRHVVAVIR